MSDELSLDEAYLSEAALFLQSATSSLREAEFGIRFSFQSITGISEITCRYLAELDEHLSHLASQVEKGAHVVTMVSDESSILDQQLARSGAAGFALPMAGG